MRSHNDIQSQLKNKISSRTGASITFALLLFLVCAVVSSVILVAGTAASGRMAQLAEMDQRYYSVTSAAEFLSNKFDGKTVTAIERKYLDGAKETKYYVYDGDYDPNDPNDPNGPKEATVSGDGYTFDGYGDDNTLLKESAVRVIKDKPGDNITKDLLLTGSGDTLSQADVDFITEIIKPSGELQFVISKDGYRLRLTFSVATSKRTESSSESSDRVYIDDVTEFTWQLKGLETV